MKIVDYLAAFCAIAMASIFFLFVVAFGAEEFPEIDETDFE